MSALPDRLSLFKRSGIYYVLYIHGNRRWKSAIALELPNHRDVECVSPARETEREWVWMMRPETTPSPLLAERKGPCLVLTGSA